MISPADRYDAFLLDLDGVVYRGDELVPGAAETIGALRERGRSVVFLTNNSARTPDRVAEKLRGLGVPAEPDDVVTSAMAAASLVLRVAGAGASAFVVGEEGVRSALAAEGIEVRDGDPRTVDVVVVGWDRRADYESLRRASVLVQRGARLVATNTDSSYPAPGGELWPGAGALVAAVETTTGARATVAGKPHEPMFEVAMERAGTDRALVVGDRVETDVEGAVRAGLDAALTLSGAATEAELLDAAALPVAVLDDLRDLLRADRLPVRIRGAGPADRETLSALLQEAVLDPAWLDAPGAEDRAVVGEVDGRAAAMAACMVRSAHGYLHSVAVAEDLRGGRVGTLVVAATAQRAAEAGARRLFLLTEGATGFFERLGFHGVDRSELPRWIQEETAKYCSPSAGAMRRELRRRQPPA